MNTRKALLSALLLALLAAVPIAASAGGKPAAGAAESLFCMACQDTDGTH